MTKEAKREVLVKAYNEADKACDEADKALREFDKEK